MHHSVPHPVLYAAAMAVLAACGSGGGAGSTSLTDTTPPQAGVVRDGVEGDISTQTLATTIAANWDGFVDDSGSIARYEWALGTTAGGTDLQDWTDVGTATSATNSSLVLAHDATVYAQVRAFDGSENESAPAVSNGVVIDLSGGGTFASSVTQWGITWEFAQPERVGQFANGDWWVVGPVDIVSIWPPTQNVGGRQINGSMVNPTTIQNGEHGYDSTLFHPYEANRYKPWLNVALGVSASSPLSLSGSKSLISTISYLGTGMPPNGSFSQLQTAAVLTVLPSAPPADAFRPPYAGHDKTIRHREVDLDYTALASLASTSGQPNFAASAARFERVWLDHMSDWTSRYMHPIDNMPDYGRDFTALYGQGALLLHTNVPIAEKRDMLVRLVQIGIDFWGNVLGGGVWGGVGGQGSGRKFPVLFAGRMLNDPQMLAMGTSHPSGYFGPNHPSNDTHFGEDAQTFYVQETSPGVFNWGHGGYNHTYVGTAEWGNNHTTEIWNDNANWTGDPYRRCCTANAWVGQTLVARIMGLRDEWNHPAYFDYMDRFMQNEQPGQWTRAWDPWQGTMWDAHRPSF